MRPETVFARHRALALAAFLLALTGAVAPAANLDLPGGIEGVKTYLFRGDDNSEPLDRFAPHEKINVGIDIRKLPAGDYTLHTEWYNPLGDLQDKAVYAFSKAEAGPFSARSWLKLDRASFMEKLFSVSYTAGYHVKFFGQWTVKLFLNGEDLGSVTFEVR